MEKKTRLKQATSKEAEGDDFEEHDDKNDDGEDDEADENHDASFDSIKSKRGRPKIPEQWSRIISLSHDDLSNLKVYELGPDILLSSAVRATLTRGKQPLEWKPFFWPETYVKEEHDMSLEGNTLTTKQLEQYG